MAKIKDMIIHSKLTNILYKCKFYLNLGIAQISWFTGKLPEIMSFLWLSQWLGYDLSRHTVVVFGVGACIGLVLMGYVWKHSGLYDVECYVNNDKNPVTKEMLDSARIIKKWKKNN